MIDVRVRSASWSDPTNPLTRDKPSRPNSCASSKQRQSRLTPSHPKTLGPADILEKRARTRQRPVVAAPFALLRIDVAYDCDLYCPLSSLRTFAADHLLPERRSSPALLDNFAPGTRFRELGGKRRHAREGQFVWESLASPAERLAVTSINE